MGRRAEGMMIGTWSYDLSRDLVRCCSVTGFLFGFSPEESAHELPLSRFVDAIHPGDRERFRLEIAHARARGGDFQVEYRIKLSSGELRRILDRGEFYMNADGIVEQARGIVVDLTDYPRAALRSTSGRGKCAYSMEPLPDMADHLLAAWEIGQQAPPHVFETLKPAFQNLLFELGLRIAETETRHPIRTSRRASLN